MKPAVIVALSLVAAFALGGAAIGAAPTATRTLLAEAPAEGAPGRLLGLSTVTVPAGVTLAKHRHPGTQLGAILIGRLTYTVFKGEVQVYRVNAKGVPVLSRTIRAGHTAVLTRGDTVAEEPNDVHMAANLGKVPVRISLASLFPKGAPAAIPVG
jgi:quercetin dioxygenase-like cupin family protein